MEGCYPINPNFLSQPPVSVSGALSENVETRPCHPGGDHGKYGNSTNSQAFDAFYGYPD
jgi:hypothetical protein